MNPSTTWPVATLMDVHRDALLTFTLDGALYEAPILQEVELSAEGATVVGRWPRFELVAEGCTAAEVYRDLLSMLTQLLDDPLSAESSPPLAELMRRSGRRIPCNEVRRREDAWLRDSIFTWTVDGCDYRAALFAGATVERNSGTVTVSAFGASATGVDIAAAAKALRTALGGRSDTSARPAAPTVVDIDRWVTRNGRPVSPDRTPAATTPHLSASHAGLYDFSPDEIVSESHTRPVLVQFWSDDCGWCLVQAPILIDIADDLAGRVLVGKLKVSHHHTAAGQFAVRSVPTLLLIHQARELHRIEGHRSARTILRELRQYLGS